MAIFSSQAAVALSPIDPETPVEAITLDTTNFPNTGNDATLRILLDNIKTAIDAISNAPDSLTAAEKRTAGYAGIGSAGAYTAGNRDIDKLTFYIMFRLPFVHSDLESHYDNPISGATTSWSRRANDLRAAFSITRLNKASEPCNSSGVATYDYSTEAGYIQMGAIKTSDGFSNYKTDLFDVGTDPDKKVYGSMHRIAAEENPWGSYINMETAKPHWTISGFAHDGSKDLSGATFFWQNQLSYTGPTPELTNQEMFALRGQTIQYDSGTGDYFIIGTLHGVSNSQIIVEPSPVIGTEQNETFPLEGSEVIIAKENPDPDAHLEHEHIELIQEDEETYTGLVFMYARVLPEGGHTNGWARRVDPNAGDNRRYLLENYGLTEATGVPGLTFGLGIDLGASLASGHERTPTWRLSISSPSTTNLFKIHWGKIYSSEMATAGITADAIKAAVEALLDEIIYPSKGRTLQNSARVWKPKRDTIYTTVTAVNATEFVITMNGALAYVSPSDFYSANPDVTIVNETSLQSIRSEYSSNAMKWSEVETVFNESFSTSISGDSWGTSGGVDSGDLSDFINVVKGSIGLQGYRAFMLYRNNYELLMDFSFEMNSLGFVKHIRSVQKNWYLPNYLTPAISKLGFSSSDLNEAEKYLIGSMCYNAGGPWKVNVFKSDLKRIVKSHNYKDLIGLADRAGFYGTRVAVVKQTLGAASLKAHFFRNVD